MSVRNATGLVCSIGVFCVESARWFVLSVLPIWINRPIACRFLLPVRERESRFCEVIFHRDPVTFESAQFVGWHMSPRDPSNSGACPSCGSPGVIGEACPERVCSMSGVCFVPAEEALAAMAGTPSQREPLVGHYIGDYLVVGRLGKGGFGKVLLALQRPLFRLKAAVKLIEFDASDERTTRKVLEKFENEAASLAVLNSPHVVRLLQYGLYHDRPYMAMEYIAGSRTLQREINRMVIEKRSLDFVIVRRVLEQVLDGLESAHRESIIHRDIKPENIMLQEVVGDPWFVKLVDFGLAKVVAESRETSMVLGTVHYMAPEQAEGRDLGPWTDLYAVGVIAFELMVGHRPFPGSEAQEILRLKLDPRFDPLARAAEEGLPGPVASFLGRALARWPEDRFRSTSDMRAALSEVFASMTGTGGFASDLSRLFNSADISELRRREQLVAAERLTLEEERRRLAAERQALVSERLKLESQRFGLPSATEHLPTAGTVILGRTGQVSVPTTEVVTGPASAGAELAPRARSRWGLMLLAGLVVVAAGVSALVLILGNQDSGEVGGVVVEVERVAAVEASKPPVEVAPTPAPAVASIDAVAPVEAPDTVALEARADDPVEPDPIEVKAVEAVAEVVPAELVIRTGQVPGAISIDGQAAVASPLVFATRVGAQHRVVVSASGHVSVSKDVVVETASHEVEVALVPVAPAIPAGKTPARRVDAAKPVEPKKTTPTQLKDF